MKKIVFVVLFLLVPTLAFASPFLVSNPQEGVTSYKIMEGASTQEVPAQANGALRMEMAGTSVGVHNITVQACSVWECSETVPFSFTRSAIVTPVGITLVK